MSHPASILADGLHDFRDHPLFLRGELALMTKIASACRHRHSVRRPRGIDASAKERDRIRKLIAELRELRRLDL